MNPNSLLYKILQYLNLEGEVDDYEKIHETIQRDVVFKGTNLWILMFAIIVASVGLNMNSTAVIIGAMLISPLMGPINGMGYSIATYNLRLFRFSVKNFTFAVFASLAASTLYFAVTPISTEHSELLARTSPTIYDVLIALFGGLAGIVAITSKQKGNVIPGVAIATALMPPLCTAGYGLATGKMNFFFGDIYLFTINTVFIALSSVLISQLLKFPIRTIVDEDQRKKVNGWITVVIIIVLIPSIFFGYKLIQNEKFKEKASMFIESVSFFAGNYLLKSEIAPEKRDIKLIYGGSGLTDDLKNQIKQRANDFLIDESSIEIQQGFTLEALRTKTSEAEKLQLEINTLKIALINKEKQVDSLMNKGMIGRQILEENRAVFPQITGCSISDSFAFQDTDSIPKKIKLVVFETDKKGLLNKEKEKVNGWVKKRLCSENVRILYNN